MLSNYINSELDDSLNGIMPVPIFCTCDIEENANQQEFPLVRSLATRDEMSLDTTKCIIIKLKNRQRIYEWFRGDEIALYIYKFVKIQLPIYETTPFELKIEKVNATNDQDGIPLNPNQSIKSQCPGLRLFINLIEKEQK